MDNRSADGSSSEAYHDGRPVSNSDTKTVLLVAGHKDTIRVDGYGEMVVAERTDCYFGADLILRSEGEDEGYRLVPHGFANDPVLWRADTDDEGRTHGWERVGEVSAEMVEVAPATQCECGEILKSKRQKRMALVAGVCPHE